MDVLLQVTFWTGAFLVYIAVCHLYARLITYHLARILGAIICLPFLPGVWIGHFLLAMNEGREK